MEYQKLSYESVKTFCEKVFQGYGFTEEEARRITDVLLTADLFGIESHGIQRLVRYDYEINSGMVNINAKPQIVHETPLSAVIEGDDKMGQLLSYEAMELAIKKAKQSGIGMVTIRNSNHYGIAGYYSKMALDQDLIGVCMTNTEAIMVPTFGRRPMLGTNPISFSMPADPLPFLFDAATTVVPRGKLEVYNKRNNPTPDGWIIDEEGLPCTEPGRVISNIINRTGGGILPLGGSGTETSGYKGYGFGMICEICTAILSGGLTSNYIYQNPGHSNICSSFWAIDYAMFGDKAEIKKNFSTYLQQVRDSDKATGQDRIFIHGERELENSVRIRKEGIPANEKTLNEMRKIGDKLGVDFGIVEFV